MANFSIIEYNGRRNRKVKMPHNFKTILLVEDDALIAMTQILLLKRYNYEVLSASTGEQAIKLCHEQAESIHLILMDIDLGPGIDGTQAAQEILRYHDIPLLFLSSHTEEEIVEKTEKITSYGYVVKNSGSTVLNASIKMAFKLHTAHNIIRLSEEKYSKAFHTSPDSININNLADGVYVAINKGFTDIMGYSEEEVIGKSSLSPDLQIWVYPEDRQKLVDGLKANGEVNNLVSTFRAKDQSQRIGMMSARIIDLHGTPCIISITRDITERTRMEARLAESETRYFNLFQSAAVGIGIFHPDGTIVSFNTMAAKNLGGKPEDYIGKNIMDLRELSDGTEYLRRIALSADSNETLTYSDRLNLAGGQHHFVSHFNRLCNTEGVAEAVQVVSINVTLLNCL